MVDLYADQHFPYAVVEILRNLGHDILNVKEAGKANQKISDREVLRFATEQNRAVSLRETKPKKISPSKPRGYQKLVL
jgi:predicted nuclease of predicted toxin-antitoxin system